jgi:polyisoprenoid-binding protein YceI
MTGDEMSSTEPGAVSYRVDSGRSRFVVKAFATGLLSAFGHSPTIAIRDFTGEAQFSPDHPETASLRVRVKAESLAVADEVSDKDRREMQRQMRDQVLETARYPEIVFESTEIAAEKVMGGQYRARVSGNLSLHGVTRPCVIAAQVIAGEDALRANGEFSLRQSDFNIRPVSAVGGTIKLKDELKFSFDIVSSKIKGELHEQASV